MTDSGSNGKKGKGFAGLDSMVSDVSEDVEKAARAAPPKAPPPEPPLTDTPAQPASPEPQPAPAKSYPSSRPWMPGIGWVIVGVIVVAIWLSNAGTGDKSQLGTSFSPPPSYSSTAPSAAPVPAPAPAAPVADEQKPTVGQDNVLSIPQIRWCKREKIRIEAIEGVINSAYDHEVDKFNAKVSDYNSRCGKFRYRRGNVEQVDRELSSEREAIALKAKSEWVRQSLGIDATQKPSRQNTTNTETQGIKPKQPVEKPKEAKASCSEDRECPGTLFCVRGTCGKQVKLGDLCNRDIECGTPGSKCVSGRCAGSSSTAPLPLPSNAKPPVPVVPEQPTRNGGVPANAEIDYTGQNWKCRHGYRRVGDQCEAVRMPANAEIDYTGQNWKCRHGYRPADGQCVAVQMPANAEIDYTGQNWKCRHGYRPVGGQCDAVQMPANAEIDYTGQSWKCRYGYRQSGNACLPL